MFQRRYRGEFRKTWFGAESREGFRVEIRSKNWIDHIRDGTRRRAFAEMMALKSGWIVHKSAGGGEGFADLSPERVDRIFDEIRRALDFLGYKVELVE